MYDFHYYFLTLRNGCCFEHHAQIILSGKKKIIHTKSLLFSLSQGIHHLVRD